MNTSITEYSAVLSVWFWFLWPIVPSVVKIGGIVTLKLLFGSGVDDLLYTSIAFSGRPENGSEW